MDHLGRCVFSDASRPCRRQDSASAAKSNGSDDDDDDEGVLYLNHFARTPFVCFGTVRVGCSKSQVLPIENPQSVPVQVVIDKFPSAKGFTVNESEFVVASMEKHYLTISWIPLNAGGIRETVTFSVGCVKVKAVFLGKAEDPPKKKRSLWDTIKRNNAMGGPLKSRRSTSINTIASKTIIISQKIDNVKTAEHRNPLQSCENLSLTEDRVSPLYHPMHVLGNIGHEVKPLSPKSTVSPVKQEFENYDPQSLKRSVTYSVLKTADNDMSLQVKEEPNCEGVYNVQCSPETFVDEPNLGNHSFKISQQILDSQTYCFPHSSGPLTTFSQHRILSPDSFVNGSYFSERDPEPSIVTKILSPDQFLKESLAVVNLSFPHSSQEEARSLPAQSSLNQSDFQSALIQERDNESIRPLQSDFPVINVKELKPVKSRLTYFVKPKYTSGSSQTLKQPVVELADQLKMLQVCPSADIKIKRLASEASDCEPEVKVKHSRRQLEVSSALNSAVGTFRSLPVIDPLTENKTTNNLHNANKKRKSSEFLHGSENEEIVCPDKRKTIQVDQVRRSTFVEKTASRNLNGGKSQRRKAVYKRLKSSTAAQRKPGKPMPGVAQSTLTFVKLTNSVIPRHPMPFAAKNMFFDERWKEKQERGFTWWLNFILTPDDFTVNTETSRVNAAAIFLGSETHFHKISVPAAPTKEEMSLRSYTAKRRLNRLRRSACRLFTSEAMVKIIQKLERAIAVKHLLVRKDRHLWKDYGERMKVLKWLLSYNTLWLRIGLETIFGELIPLENNSDVIGLGRFILNRLLWNSDVVAEYRHPTVPHLYRDEHKEVLAQFTLKKFLLLVWFLDCAKQSRLIDHDPCLFCKDAEFKSSKDLLLAFSRDFLSGEGDLCRHLSYMGLTVSHFQTALHEFNFAVTNLAVDLRCGVRIVRAVELLTQDWTFSKHLRVPTISRLQKLHNVETALKALKMRGIDLKADDDHIIDSRDIVDGHRERTLALLWRIVFAFQVEILLNVDHLNEEIEFLETSLHNQQMLTALQSMSVPSGPVKDHSQIVASKEYHPQVKLLMDWVNAVCAYHGVKVENFTVPFSDGRVLCYLIHHYHPGLLPADAICQRTTQTVEFSQRGSVAIDTLSGDSDESSIDISSTVDIPLSSSTLYEELLENEKKNFHLAATAVVELGGVPAMIRHLDMSNTIPDEKVVITYLSFLCARLLDLRKETRAARLIQAAWRKYKLNRELKVLQVRNQAACVIQAAVCRFFHRRHFKKKTNAAVIIQAYCRGYMARKKAKELLMMKVQTVQNAAATVIQSWYRMSREKRSYLRQRRSCIRVQSWYRCCRAKRTFYLVKKSTLFIQEYYKAYQRGKAQVKKYRSMRQGTITIQAYFRGMKARQLVRKVKAAYIIQSYWLTKKERLVYLHRRQCVIMLQAHVRRWQAQLQYKTMKTAVCILQVHTRAFLKRRKTQSEYKAMRFAAIVLQSTYRGRLARRHLSMLRSVVKIQSAFRAYVVRRRFSQIKKAAIKIQAFVKMIQEQKRYRSLKNTVVYLQSCYRANKLCSQKRKEYIRKKEACICLQSGIRHYLIKKKMHLWRQAAIKIQSKFRMHQQRRQYLRTICAAIIIQRRYRAYCQGFCQRQKFLETREAAICLQAAYRGYVARKILKLHCKAAIIVQAAFRRHVLRMKYLAMQKASIAIQRWYRAYKIGQQQRAKYRKIRSGTILLQALYRGFSARKKRKVQYEAAKTIQTAFRRFQAQKQFAMLKNAVLTIQQYFKAKLVGNKQRQVYLRLCHSAAILQAAYKGMLVRKEIKRKREACIVIQSYFRMHKMRTKFKLLKLATLVIQVQSRAYLQGKRQRQRYQEMKNAAIILQAAFHAMKARKKCKEVQQAASIIQTAFRSYSARKRYLSLRATSTLLQRRFRALLLTKQQRKHYFSVRSAALSIQAAYRGMKARQEVQHMHWAATVIQSMFRMHKVYIPYRATRLATIIIQIHYRAHIERKTERENYLKIRRCVVVLQAAFRGMKDRKHLSCMHKSATVIQAAYRMHRQRYLYERLCWAAVVIQQRYRACKVRDAHVQQYTDVTNAVTCIQAAFRGMKTRRNIQRIQQAALAIQGRFRAYQERKKYLSLKAAATKIQQQYRGLRLTRMQRQQYLSIRNATVCFQATYRGMRVRQLVRSMHCAATVIQSMFRMHKVYVPYQATRLATIIIQIHYRAHIEMKTERENYLKIRRCVVVLQAAFRGMKDRKHLSCMHKSATVIQAAYRMHRQRYLYERLCWAAVVIQQRYRACKVRDAHVQQYTDVRNAVTCIQAAFRGMKTRRNIQRIQHAVMVIQGRFRASNDRKKYLSLKAAASKIQQQYRSLRLTRMQRAQYLSVCNAAVCVQATYRGMRVRQLVRSMHWAATVIQSMFRMHKVYIPYRATRLATIIIQIHYRAHIERKTERENYLKIRRCVVVLQAAFRGMKDRKHLSCMHKSATVIQAAYRMHRQRYLYERICWAAVVIQQRYRACKVRDAHVQQYNAMRNAVTCIQAAFRGMKTRRNIQRIQQAALAIQGRFRAYQERKKYLSLKAAATKIQQQYRGLLLTRTQRQQYLSVRNATVCFQATYRGMRVRQLVQSMHCAATVIQSTFRMHKVYVPYRATRLATIIIQIHYRAHIEMKTERENYLKIRCCVVVLQAAFRGMKDRKHLSCMHKSATVIQAAYRMHRQRYFYERLFGAAVVIQQRYRACKVRDVQVEQYSRMKKAIVHIQALYRGRKARNLAQRIKSARLIQSFLQMCVVRKLFLHQKSSAIILQATFRGYRARVHYKTVRSAAISIQCWYRACIMGKLQLIKFQTMKCAVISIQAAYKGMRARKWYKQKRAAVKIQSVFCMLMHQKRFLQIKFAAITIQSQYRAYKARKIYKSYKGAALILQRHFKSHLMRKEQRLAYLAIKQKIVFLQSTIRGFIVRRNYRKLQKSTKKIQACYRKAKDRKKFLLFKKAVSVIQQHFRAHCQRKVEQQKYLQMKHAAIVIQASFRGHQARQLVNKMRAARKIQAWFRAYAVCKRYKAVLKSVAFIHGQFRIKQERSRFLKVRTATIIIQQRWRRIVEARRVQHEYQRKRTAAVKIQAFWRGFKTRKQIIRMQEAACRIQHKFRGYKERKKFLGQKSAVLTIQRRFRVWQLEKTEKLKLEKWRRAAIVLQAIWREFQIRKEVAERKCAAKRRCFTAAVYHHLCAVKIQRTYRSYVALKFAKEKIKSVICIQRWFRTYLQRCNYLKERQQIVAVQRTVKIWLTRRNKAAAVIQKAVRKFLNKMRRKRFCGRIIAIQALWKGYYLRKKMDNPRIIAIRCRIQQATAKSSEEQKLGNRTAIALNYILKYRHFSWILAALQHLEVATRLSSLCCENFAGSGATPIIFALIRSCNRSVPSMDIIKYAIQVLLNVSKYEKTSGVVFEVKNSITILIDLLQMYRERAGDKTADKCGSIFTKVCCLLAILSQDSQKAMEVRSVPRALDRIHTIYDLTLRKHKMDTDREIKQRLNDPRNSSLFIPATPVRTKVVSRLKPDWVLRRGNMKEIVDPLKAIQLVVDTLGISTNL